MTKKEVIFTPKVPAPVRHFGRTAYYSQANKVGNLVFISGMTGRKTDAKSKRGWTIVKGDPKGQTIQAIENIKNTLEVAGGSLDDVVKITAYITRRRHFDQIARVLTTYFFKDPPALTLVFVPELAVKDFLVELDATAAV